MRRFAASPTHDRGAAPDGSRGGRRVYLAAVAVASLLALAATFVVTSTHIADARAEVETVERDLMPASLAATELSGALRGVLDAYMSGITTLDASTTQTAATLGLEFQNFTGAWERYEQASQHLPEEAAFAGRIQAALAEVANDPSAGASMLDSATSSANDEAGLRRRLAAAATSLGMSSSLLDDADGIVALYDAARRDRVAAASVQLERTETTSRLLTVAVMAFIIVLFGFVERILRQREGALARIEAERSGEADRNRLEASLQRAFDMVDDDEPVFILTERALRAVLPAVPVEMLAADSSRAHLHQVLRSNVAPEGGCPAATPGQCPAIKGGQTLVFNSSEDIDSCPHLSGRASGSCSAVCVPVSIAGSSSGVLHATGADGFAPDGRTIATLELVARRVGDRLGLLHVFARSEMQARTDVLTGLVNRRSVEEAARTIAEDGAYCVAYGDLDHFKALNDTFGHDTGDRALRLFARALRDSVRPEDLPARYGGEEFLVVLPRCAIEDAVVVIDRIRRKLSAAIDASALPAFTASFGIAAGDAYGNFADTVARADSALLRAKSDGRDRVVAEARPAGAGGLANAAGGADAPLTVP